MSNNNACTLTNQQLPEGEADRRTYEICAAYCVKKGILLEA